jgi:hypothetical protein
MEQRAASPEISWADIPPLGIGHELESLERLGALEWGELLVEVEEAFRRPDDEGGTSGPGALIVTDLQILFIATSMPRRRVQHLIRIPLAQVVDIDSTVRKCALRSRPTVEIEAKLDGSLQTFAFPLRVRSGARADEIARSIVRERRGLAKRRKRRDSAPGLRDGIAVDTGLALDGGS